MKYQIRVFTFMGSDDPTIPSGWEPFHAELDEVSDVNSFGILRVYCKHAYIHSDDRLK